MAAEYDELLFKFPQYDNYRHIYGTALEVRTKHQIQNNIGVDSRCLKNLDLVLKERLCRISPPGLKLELSRIHQFDHLKKDLEVIHVKSAILGSDHRLKENVVKVLNKEENLLDLTYRYNQTSEKFKDDKVFVITDKLLIRNLKATDVFNMLTFSQNNGSYLRLERCGFFMKELLPLVNPNLKTVEVIECLLIFTPITLQLLPIYYSIKWYLRVFKNVEKFILQSNYLPVKWEKLIAESTTHSGKINITDFEIKVDDISGRYASISTNPECLHQFLMKQHDRFKFKLNLSSTRHLYRFETEEFLKYFIRVENNDVDHKFIVEDQTGISYYNCL